MGVGVTVFAGVCALWNVGVGVTVCRCVDIV